MKNIMIIALLNILSLSVFSGCAVATRIDGPYRGRIIDADTREPIEGVVVLGVWYKEYAGAGGAIHKFYDARETVTNNNGEFSIPGMGLMIISNVIPARFSIFKAGYYFNDYTSGKTLSKGNAIIQLKKLTMEQRRKQGSPDYPSEAPEEKIRMMLREINKDRMEKGLKPVN